ncbi:MAG: hypothetical protein JXA74_11715, partial [Anaerolineae bacterium]|nr:hypothetical protein [Anaerolineae bacterium]
MENPLTTPPLAQPPERYILLPWGWASALKLPDHLRLTYELVVALALGHDGRSTQAVTRRQLAAWRSVALRTLDDHLAALRARGLVRSAVAAQGRGLVLRPTSLPRPQAVIRSAVGEIADPAPGAVIGDTCRRDGSSR